MSAFLTLVSPSSYSAQSTVCIAIAAAILLFAYRALKYLKPANNFDVPLLFAEFDTKTRAGKWATESDKVLQAGHQLFREGNVPMYRVTTEDGTETIIVNDRYLKELKSLPDSFISAERAVNKDMLYEYSHIKVVDPVGQHAIRTDLTPGLPRLMPSIAAEAVDALDNYFPQYADDWVPVAVFQAVLNSVAQVSARLFVGARLCRDPRWLKCSQTAAINAFATVSVMRRWPAWMRPFAQYIEPEKRALEASRAEAMVLLKEDAKTRQSTSNDEEHEDCLYNWIADRDPVWAKDFTAQAALQLELSIAAIHTTTMAVTHIMYDLAAHAKYVPMLREEIKSALNETGGVYNKDCITKLVKTDSFMKESQRLHPPAFTIFKREVLKDFTLSDGTTFPKGISFQVDATARYHDPAIWENPDQFDGLRFQRLTHNDPQKGRHQYVSANLDYVFWGQGKHACPGRFFAANEIKTLVAMLILRYDMSLEHGSERPADETVGTFVCIIYEEQV